VLAPQPLTPRAAPAPPRGPWRWFQSWRDVFFAHWAVPAEALAAHLPAGVDADLWDGSAWVSAVAFHLETVRLRGLPAVGLGSNFLELNLRTYVRCRGEPGIAFLSLHANKRSAIALARWLTPLPYAFARIEYRRHGRAWRFTAAALCDAEFAPEGAMTALAADSLDGWLLERYRAFVPDRRGRLRRLAVDHPPWQVGRVSSGVRAGGLGVPWGLDLGRAPDLAHFAPGVPAWLWPFQPV
jgi:uncharacterized protein YqjF (DUF2071 family)